MQAFRGCAGCYVHFCTVPCVPPCRGCAGCYVPCVQPCTVEVVLAAICIPCVPPCRGCAGCYIYLVFHLVEVVLAAIYLVFHLVEVVLAPAPMGVSVI